MDVAKLRELDHREGDGIEVSLLWRAADDSVHVSVVDHRMQEQFTERVDPTAAHDAFQHPYAYHPRRARQEESARCAS